MNVSTLGEVAEEAQRALRDRPLISIRRRLTLALLAWFVLSLGITAFSVLVIGRVKAKLAIASAMDRYTFEIQQARRYEKNFFLYGTNLSDALDQLHAAQRIVEQESGNMAAVIGETSVAIMQAHVRRYAELLGRLDGLDRVADAERVRAIEEELRVHGGEMLVVAEDLAGRERQAITTLLLLSQRIALVFLVVLLVLIVLLAVFVARQMLAPLHRIVVATRSIADGSPTPITPKRKYRDEFSELAMAVNYMLYQLVQRQQLLVQTHKLKAIGTLTAGVAHELNNPINNIMLTASRLEEDFKDLSGAEKLDMARDLVSESERARTIVRNLLDFARESETGVQPLEIRKIVTDTILLASNQAKLAGVKIQTELGQALPTVHGDPGQLTQVFLNLVLNAIDAMPAGGTLTISVGQTSDGESVEIRFTDTGIGIPEQHLGSVFDPFFTSKKKAKGTGLGLSVSLGIVKQQGGDIQVQSRVGKGTTFTVSLPTAKVPASIPVAVA